jgi:hypothetical protein
MELKLGRGDCCHTFIELAGHLGGFHYTVRVGILIAAGSKGTDLGVTMEPEMGHGPPAISR